MSRKFIAAVLAISTTIASVSAVPARAASEEEIARLLAGAATLFIIGKAIQNSRDDDDDRKKSVRHYTPENGFKPQIRSHDRDEPRVIPRGYHSRDRHVIPARCVRQIEDGRVGRVVMQRCLERNDIRVRALPKACRMNVATRRGTARAYALPCLRHRGYTLARH